jgi:branched-chain amino acid transport system ATP-binding protein
MIEEAGGWTPPAHPESPMPDEQIQLAVEAIEADYNQAIVALHGVSFSVRRGEIRALLGSNGAGKTTTLRAVTNLLNAERGRLTAGSIRFEGRDVNRTPTGDLVRLGLVHVLEGRHVFRSLTVEENLVTGAIGRDATHADVVRDVARVYGWFPRLAERRRTLAGLTSGGEQQMLAIGRALMARPRLLVLDEPSMGLAPLVVQEIFRTLKQLNAEEHLSILVAEQNSAVALSYADTATVLENGVSILEGTAAELRDRDDIKASYLGKGPPRAA